MQISKEFYNGWKEKKILLRIVLFPLFIVVYLNAIIFLDKKNKRNIKYE